MTMTTTLTPLEDLDYEQARLELESIVAALETEKHALEQAIALYERGMLLTRRCTDLLDQAELKVQQISGDELQAFDGG
jgi:exodeoxyribonuclease VII small subunit